MKCNFDYKSSFIFVCENNFANRRRYVKLVVLFASKRVSLNS